jgi:hypothetical protein
LRRRWPGAAPRACTHGRTSRAAAAPAADRLHRPAAAWRCCRRAQARAAQRAEEQARLRLAAVAQQRAALSSMAAELAAAAGRAPARAGPAGLAEADIALELRRFEWQQQRMALADRRQQLWQVGPAWVREHWASGLLAWRGMAVGCVVQWQSAGLRQTRGQAQAAINCFEWSPSLPSPLMVPCCAPVQSMEAREHAALSGAISNSGGGGCSSGTAALPQQPQAVTSEARPPEQLPAASSAISREEHHAADPETAEQPPVLLASSARTAEPAALPAQPQTLQGSGAGIGRPDSQPASPRRTRRAYSSQPVRQQGAGLRPQHAAALVLGASGSGSRSAAASMEGRKQSRGASGAGTPVAGRGVGQGAAVQRSSTGLLAARRADTRPLTAGQLLAPGSLDRHTSLGGQGPSVVLGSGQPAGPVLPAGLQPGGPAQRRLWGQAGGMQQEYETSQAPLPTVLDVCIVQVRQC